MCPVCDNVVQALSRTVDWNASGADRAERNSGPGRIIDATIGNTCVPVPPGSPGAKLTASDTAGANGADLVGSGVAAANAGKLHRTSATASAPTPGPTPPYTQQPLAPDGVSPDHLPCYPTLEALLSQPVQSAQHIPTPRPSLLIRVGAMEAIAAATRFELASALAPRVTAAACRCNRLWKVLAGSPPSAQTPRRNDGGTDAKPPRDFGLYPPNAKSFPDRHTGEFSELHRLFRLSELEETEVSQTAMHTVNAARLAVLTTRATSGDPESRRLAHATQPSQQQQKQPSQPLILRFPLSWSPRNQVLASGSDFVT